MLIAENQFRLDNLQQQASLQQASYEKLRLEVAQLEAPARIVSVAEGKLGMRQPGSVTYLPATHHLRLRREDGDAIRVPVPTTVPPAAGTGTRRPPRPGWHCPRPAGRRGLASDQAVPEW